MQINFFEEQKIQFMEEIALKIPMMDQHIRDRVMSIFAAHGRDIERFNHHVNELEQDDALKTQIINIATNVLCNESKRKAEEELEGKPAKQRHLEPKSKKRAGARLDGPEAKRPCLAGREGDEPAICSANAFLEQLIEDGNEVDNLDEKIESLMGLLSSEKRPIAHAAWACLCKLSEFENYQMAFCHEEKLQTLMLLLEKFAKDHRTGFLQPESHSNCEVDAPPLKELSSLPSRLVAVLSPLLLIQEVDAIVEAACCLAKFICSYQKKFNTAWPLGNEEIKPLMALLQAKNDELVWPSLFVQNNMRWDPEFQAGLQAEGLEKIFDKVISSLGSTKNQAHIEAIFIYLKKLHLHFNAAHKRIFNALPAMLLAFAKHHELAIVKNSCWLLGEIDDIDFYTAFCQQGGLNVMLALLQDFNARFQAAIEQQKKTSQNLKAENSTPAVKLLEGIVLYAARSISEKCLSFFDAAFAQSLCDVLIAMLKQPSPKIVVLAACRLGSLSKISKENFQQAPVAIGLQSIRPLVELLLVEDEKVLHSALFALREFAWNDAIVPHLLKMKVLERVKVLLLQPKEFAAVAFQLCGICIKAKGEIDDADAAFIQKILFPALNGKHALAAARCLNVLLAVKGFPEALGREVLDTVLLLLKSKEDFLIEAAYWCLGNLSKLNLASEIYRSGIIDAIEALFDAENTPAIIIEGAGYCCSETLIRVFKDRPTQSAFVCLCARFLSTKYTKVQAAGLWCLHEFAKQPESDLTLISHASIAKAVNLLGSQNEEVACGAMWLFGKLCADPSNHDESFLKTTVDLLLEWVKKNSVKPQILALRALERICFHQPALRSYLISEGALDLLRPLLVNSSLQESILCLITHFSDLPEQQERWKKIFTEKTIMAFLKYKNSKIKEAMISILVHIIDSNTFMQTREEAIQLIWPLPETQDPTLSKSLLVLAKLLSEKAIMSQLQSAADVSKQDFLTFLSILSIQQKSMPAIDDVPPSSSKASPYKGWYQPNGKNKFFDIALQVDDCTPQQCHKVVLAANCEYFNRMLSSSMQESDAALIKIKEVDPNLFNKLIQFLYEQQYHFTTIEEAFGLYELAQRFVVPMLEVSCRQFLVKQLSKETVEEIFFAALTFPTPDLKTRVMQWMMSYYLELPQALQEHIQHDETWREFYTLLATKGQFRRNV